MGQDRTRSKGADTIDANLKRVYLDVLNEAVPDRFVALLEQLRAQDAAAGRAAPDATDAAADNPSSPNSPANSSVKSRGDSRA